MISIGPLKLRQAYFNDIESLADIGRKTYFHTYYDHFKSDYSLGALDSYLTKAFSLERIAFEYAQPDVKFFLLQKEYKTLGYLKISGFSIVPTEVETSALVLERFYIEPIIQRQGVGGQIINFIVRLTQEQNKSLIRLCCWENHHSSLNFYHRHGFKIVDKTTFEIEGTPFKDTDFVLEKDVHQNGIQQ